jgi:flagellar basal body-associated protein FliL
VAIKSLLTIIERQKRKMKYQNTVIVCLLLLVGALAGGWIVYGVMTAAKPITQSHSHEATNARIDTTDNNDSLRAITNEIVK